MTPIRLLRDFSIAPDGIRVERWQAWSERSVDDATLEILISEGACEIVEVKAHSAAPENKARRSRKSK